MTITKEDFNLKILENIGLEENEEGFIVDEDTGDLLQVKGKMIKTKDLDYNSIEYNPLENPMLMSNLFNYYLSKNERETGVSTRVFSHSSSNRKEKGYVLLIQEDETVYESGRYFNDSLKYADIILKMNSAVNNVDLKPLDTFIQSRGAKRRVSTK